MSKIIGALNSTSLDVKEKVNLANNITRYGHYESGNYETYLNETIELIESENFLDIYSLCLALNSEFILKLDDRDSLTKIFDNYISFIKDSFDLLSPNDERQRVAFFEKGINIILVFVEINLKEIYKETDIEADAIQSKLEELLIFLDEKELKYDDYSKTQLFKILSQISHIQQKREESLKEDEGSSDEDESDSQNAENNSDLDKEHIDSENQPIISKPSDTQSIGSYKWTQLLEKIKALSELVDGNRIFEASIVYEDVKNQITAFDPCEYFPEVFSPLYRKLTPIATKVDLSIGQYSSTPQWHMAKKMYETDMKSFLLELERMPENDAIDSIENQGNYNQGYSNEQNYDYDNQEMFQNREM